MSWRLWAQAKVVAIATELAVALNLLFGVPPVNLTMVVVVASVSHTTGNTGIDSIEGAHAGLERLVGGGAAPAFSVALLASGLSSSSVGTYASQVVMQGFTNRRIPLFVRRAVAMTPALIVLAVGLDVTSTLVVSPVVLSFGIPFALVPMILLTRRAAVMGTLVNRWPPT